MALMPDSDRQTRRMIWAQIRVAALSLREAMNRSSAPFYNDTVQHYIDLDLETAQGRWSDLWDELNYLREKN